MCGDIARSKQKLIDVSWSWEIGIQKEKFREKKISYGKEAEGGDAQVS